LTCAIRLHWSLSWAFLLHPSIPISRTSSWTSSSHLTPFSPSVNFLSHHSFGHSTVLHSFYVTDPTYSSCLHKSNSVFSYYVNTVVCGWT
jgi:hypothetical protein